MKTKTRKSPVAGLRVPLDGIQLDRQDRAELTSGAYADGYQAGLIARVKAQKAAQKQFKVKNDEIMAGILR